MKKILFPSILLFLLVFLFVPHIASAAPFGNPEVLGGFGKVKLDLEYDNSRTNLRFNGGHQAWTSSDGTTYATSFPPPGVSVNHMHLNTQTGYAVITVGVRKNADVFAGIGINRAKIGLDLSYVNGTESHDIRDKSNVPWKAGVRAKLAEISGITVGGTVQYSALDVNGRYEIGGRDLSILFPGNVSYSTKTEIREWQGALTAQTHDVLGWFDPYVGVTYMKTSVKNTTMVSAPAGGVLLAYVFRVDADAESENNVGMVIGTGMKLPIRGLSANFEGRAFNKRAATASLSYRF